MRTARAGVGIAIATFLLSISGAYAKSAPTLGVRGNHPASFGFGQVRPHQVNYGGDPTSFVTDVKWQSWGGARAVGHGKALWVWPGWCVACGGVELPATVVAFGRTTCQGHSAYAYVEWFFPSRGQSFDRRAPLENVCRWTFPPSPPFKELKCGQVPLRSGSVSAVAKNIDMLDSPISCAAARQFVANSGAAAYLGRNARFTVNGWWCGSQLSMSFGGSPQMFECVRGNTTNLTFELTRA